MNKDRACPVCKKLYYISKDCTDIIQCEKCGSKILARKFEYVPVKPNRLRFLKR